MAATTAVIAHQGDTVESLCYRHLKHTAGVTEQVLLLNPGIARHGPILPEGTTVLLPTQTAAPAKKQTVQLWD